MREDVVRLSFDITVQERALLNAASAEAITQGVFWKIKETNQQNKEF